MRWGAADAKTDLLALRAMLPGVDFWQAAPEEADAWEVRERQRPFPFRLPILLKILQCN
jgi:hypothetical protein